MVASLKIVSDESGGGLASPDSHIEQERKIEHVFAQAKTESELLVGLQKLSREHDLDTAVHVMRMAEVSAELGRRLGLCQYDCGILKGAAVLHDLGKIFVPQEILLKPGKLTPEEWVIVRMHSARGHEILLRAIERFPDSRYFQVAADIALYHHENWDGSGYPHRTMGDGIPLSAQVVAVADVFDALINERAYKIAWSAVQVKDEIEHLSGTKFNPKVAKVFLDNFNDMVRINTEWDMKWNPYKTMLKSAWLRPRAGAAF